MTVARRAVTSSVVSFTKHTQPGKFTPQRETKNVWPTEPHKSITDWNVESRGANYNSEDSLNHFKMSMSSINYSSDLRIITLVSLYIQYTMYYNICFLFYVRVRNEILGITNVGLSLCQSNLNICHRLSPSGTRVLTSGDGRGLVTRAWSASDQSHY